MQKIAETKERSKGKRRKSHVNCMAIHMSTHICAYMYGWYVSPKILHSMWTKETMNSTELKQSEEMKWNVYVCSDKPIQFTFPFDWKNNLFLIDSYAFARAHMCIHARVCHVCIHCCVVATLWFFPQSIVVKTM